MLKSNEEWRSFAPSDKCVICGAKSLEGSDLCPRCRSIYKRGENRKGPDGNKRRLDKRARYEAMHNQWRPDLGKSGAFECAYTGMALTHDYPSRLYATWEHVDPGDEATVVLVADLVNKMKADMTMTEFEAMVRALVGRFDGGPFEKPTFLPQ